jgi:hypothetical protein
MSNIKTQQSKQIRVTRTKEIDEVLEYLKMKFSLLNESELVKLVLSKFYNEIKSKKVVKKTNIKSYSTKDINSIKNGLKDIEGGKYTIVNENESIEEYLNNL